MSESGVDVDLRGIYEELAAALAGDPDRDVRWGPDLAADDSPAAAALRAAEVSWQWTAVGLAARPFWDLHVGILPAESGYWVGLHWTPALDHEVRPWMQSLVPDGALRFAPLAGEYQLLSPGREHAKLHNARSAVTAALEIASRVRSKVRTGADPRG